MSAMCVRICSNVCALELREPCVRSDNSPFQSHLPPIAPDSIDGHASSNNNQAHGKGMAPEAGSWHGAAGLRIKPERVLHCDATACTLPPPLPP